MVVVSEDPIKQTFPEGQGWGEILTLLEQIIAGGHSLQKA